MFRREIPFGSGRESKCTLPKDVPHLEWAVAKNRSHSLTVFTTLLSPEESISWGPLAAQCHGCSGLCLSCCAVPYKVLSSRHTQNFQYRIFSFLCCPPFREHMCVEKFWGARTLAPKHNVMTKFFINTILLFPPSKP